MKDRELFHTVMAMIRGDKYETANETVHAIIQTVWQAARQAPASGEVAYDGGDLAAMAEDRREKERMCYVPERLLELAYEEMSDAAAEAQEGGEYCLPEWVKIVTSSGWSTHPPAKVPEDVIVAARGYLLSDGPYDWSSVDRAHAVKVLANRGLLTTPTPATTPKTELVRCAEKYDVRGFQGYKRRDYYGHEYSIQKSSLATEDCIWFGLSNACPRVLHGDAKKLGVKTDATCGWVDFPIPEEVSLNTRMHLSREQVAEILPALETFAKTGELPAPPQEQ